MKNSLELMNFFDTKIHIFLGLQIDCSKAPSDFLSKVITHELDCRKNILQPNFVASFPVLETACHLGMPNEPDDLSCVLSMHLSLGVNTVLHTAAIRANGVGYPRGLILSGVKNPFLKNDYEQNGIFWAPPLEKKDFDRLRRNLPQSIWELLLEPCLAVLLDTQSFSDQLAYLNYWLLKIKYGIEIVTIPLEKITGKLLFTNIGSKGFFYELITKSSFRNHVLDSFFGIKGCWGPRVGTFLFFGRNSKNDLVSLELQQDWLVGRERDLKIRLDADEILELLAQGDLIPSIFTSLTLLLFENVQLFGGYFQIDYLGLYIQKLKELGFDVSESQNCFGCGFKLNSATLDELLLCDCNSDELKMLVTEEVKRKTLREGLTANLDYLKNVAGENSVFSKLLSEL
ncbi:MAG: hypothetical protein NZO16_05215 [Deltaproteobacteria bacterium]|nr:hypothetical protein [Deltaproteobacteria bacterium]